MTETLIIFDDYFRKSLQVPTKWVKITKEAKISIHTFEAWQNHYSLRAAIDFSPHLRSGNTMRKKSPHLQKFQFIAIKWSGDFWGFFQFWVGNPAVRVSPLITLYSPYYTLWSNKVLIDQENLPVLYW